MVWMSGKNWKTDLLAAELSVSDILSGMEPTSFILFPHSSSLNDGRNAVTWPWLGVIEARRGMYI